MGRHDQRGWEEVPTQFSLPTKRWFNKGSHNPSTF